MSFFHFMGAVYMYAVPDAVFAGVLVSMFMTGFVVGSLSMIWIWRRK